MDNLSYSKLIPCFCSKSEICTTSVFLLPHIVAVMCMVYLLQ